MSPKNQLANMINETGLQPLHWRVWFLSAMGIFLDGFDLFIIGVAMPLISADFNPSPMLKGLIGSSTVLGSVVGAAFLGFLTDRWGRKFMYIFDLMIFIVFSILCGFSWDPISLIVFRFILGVGIGADYPICASYVSEFMPARIRGRMLIGAFSFQALGMLGAALAGLVTIMFYPEIKAWRWMLVMGAIPAAVVMIYRVRIPESPRWCMEHGKYRKASKIISKLIPERKAEIEKLLLVDRPAALAAPQHHSLGKKYALLFSPRYLGRTILASVPWLMMDIATYGIGIFMPTILAAMTMQGSDSFIGQIFEVTEDAAILDFFLIFGFLINLGLVEKWGRIKLQIIGLAGMTAGLAILAYAASQPVDTPHHLGLIFMGFMIFNLLMNMGPNATTFILPAELFATDLRASGHGFASSAAKIGAALGIFILPILHEYCGMTVTMCAIGGATLVGLIVTVIFRIETSGKTLEELDPPENLD